MERAHCDAFRLSEGGDRARRYDPTTVPFAAARDDEPESLAALGALPRPGDSMILLQQPAVAIPDGLVPVLEAQGVQMVLDHPPEPVADARIVRLGPADAAEMLVLADLTKPALPSRFARRRSASSGASAKRAASSRWRASA